MAAKEGMRRVIKAISVIAWTLFAITAVSSVGVLFGTAPGMFFAVLGLGLVAFILLQGVAWILAGFSGLEKGNDGLVRWPDLWSWRRRNGKINTVIGTGPVGVGGWLWFYILCLLVFWPLTNVVQAMSSIHEVEAAYPGLVALAGWSEYKIFAWIAVFGTSVVYMISGHRLWKVHRPKSVSMAIWVMWLAPLLLILAFAVFSNIFLGAPVAEFFADTEVWKTIFQAAIQALIWTMYLRLSRRVQNTYYQRLYPTYGTVAQLDREEPTL